MSTGDTPWSGRALHFVGIGGAGMSGLALIAHRLGARVTGSDRVATPYMAELRALGIEPAIGHRAENVPPGAELVYSSAVASDNPERVAGARELHRADLLGEITRLRRCIAVTGTHGKTTTSAMIVHALQGAGMDPSYAIGGELRATGANAGWGTGEWLVVEADESDRSLLKLSAEIAVLTNAELDHHATYASLADLEATFARFMADAEHRVVWDRPELRALCPPNTETFDAPDPELGPDGSRFAWRGLEVNVGVPGAHNARNAAAALTAASRAGADPAKAAASLASFTGARRRMELLGHTPTGAAVYDDYAHHPTEVAAVIAAARSMRPRRVVAVFQPHLFSRTRALADGFGRALAAADVVVVLGIYPARERAADFPDVSGRLVAAAAADAAGGRPVAWVPEFADAERLLRSALREGDLCLVIGAGDVDALGRRLVAIAT
ncbi:MAG TPA: UDP-N-acetylmuramate--L-alanine ligase [Solirubrobacteraceae bacterium]|nr:UDP-N-acetylmuramate--L-alanine ligase [Solirubrobacteraceae bacterium]